MGYAWLIPNVFEKRPVTISEARERRTRQFFPQWWHCHHSGIARRSTRVPKAIVHKSICRSQTKTRVHNFSLAKFVNAVAVIEPRDRIPSRSLSTAFDVSTNARMHVYTYLHGSEHLSSRRAPFEHFGLWNWSKSESTARAKKRERERERERGGVSGGETRDGRCFIDGGGGGVMDRCDIALRYSMANRIRVQVAGCRVQRVRCSSHPCVPRHALRAIRDDSICSAVQVRSPFSSLRRRILFEKQSHWSFPFVPMFPSFRLPPILSDGYALWLSWPVLVPLHFLPYILLPTRCTWIVNVGIW